VPTAGRKSDPILDPMRDRTSTAPACYAAVFCERERPPVAGGVIVEDDQLILTGRQGETHLKLCLPYAELCQVRIGRAADELLSGQPTIVVERHHQPSIRIRPLGAGLLHELTDLLTTLAAQHSDRSDEVTVRVPLKSGCSERVRELVAQGPPFDPAALGLERHQVFLGATEAIFVLRGPDVRERLERVMKTPSFWRAGLAWSTLIAGPPRISEIPADRLGHCGLIYTWAPNGKQQ
jgi:hypothetical protein